MRTPRVSTIGIGVGIAVLLALGGCHKREKRARRSGAGPGASVAGPGEAAPSLHQVRTAQLEVTVGELERARDRVEKLAAQLGGYLQRARYVVGEERAQRRWEGTVRVPEPKLMQALTELRRLGRVRREDLETREVGAAIVDLGARLKNARAAEARLQEIARSRPGSIAELLKIEGELGRVRGRIEQLSARSRRLSSQVRYAEIGVELRPKAPAAPTGFAQIGAAFVGGWAVAEQIVIGLGIVLGYLWAVLLFGGLAFLLLWRSRHLLGRGWRRLAG